MLELQRRDIRQVHQTLDLDPQAIDARLVGPHQLWQVKIFGITGQGNARYLIDPHPEQLRGRAVGRNDATAHVDGQHRKLQRPEQGVELHMPALAGHQTYTLYAKHPGDGFKLRTQGLKLQVDQIGAVQVNRIALIAADLPALDVDAVGHQQVENVAKNANPVLAVDFDTHGNCSEMAESEDQMWERACSRCRRCDLPDTPQRYNREQARSHQ